MRPRLTSGKRASSGRIGSPAASALVQPDGAQARVAQAPGRARAGAPATALAAQRVELEQLAAVAIDEQRVAIAVGVRPALDVDAARDRVAHAVRLVGVLEAH